MSPIKSKSQLRRFGELVKNGTITKEEFDKWVSETPDLKSLPERISRPSKNIRKVKIIK